MDESNGGIDVRGCSACGATVDEKALLRGFDRLHGSPGSFEIRCCDRCGSGVTFPDATTAVIGSFYPRDYGPYETGGSVAIRATSHLIRWYQVRRTLSKPPVSALTGLPAGRIVDVGCGRGDLAAGFVGLGWHAVGVEPSAEACATARERGVETRHGTLADVALEARAYDAVLFQHSLEHTPDVAGDLARASRALRPGGLLIATVPNFGSWQRRRFGDRWYHLDLPRHRTHFTTVGLARAMEGAGLRVESTTTSTSAVGLPATIQYAIVGRCLFPSGLGLRVASGLCTLMLPLARLLDRIVGGGDQLHVIARKPL